MSDGFLVVDKEPGMTSHDVVAIARKALGTRKVGHAGTLDPMATGVLVLGFNNGTRLLQYITDGEKSYTATIVLGASTTTDDHEGEILTTVDATHISDEEIEAGLRAMVGEIMQRPTKVSAIKVGGKRAYDLARQGEEFELPARPVKISELRIKEIQRNDSGVSVDIEVTCSAGTYIRAIARDLGETLGVGGHLNKLRRTRVAGFTLDRSIDIAQLKSGSFSPLELVDVAQATFPMRTVNESEVTELGFGRSISPSDSTAITAAISQEKQLIALVENRAGFAKPIAVFAAAK